MNRIATLAALLTAAALAIGQGIPFALDPFGRGFARDPDTLTITATVTAGSAANLTATIERLRSSEPFTVDWGDGHVDSFAANTNHAPSRQYASAGSRRVTVSGASKLTNVFLQNAKLSGLKSRELRNAGVTDFRVNSNGSVESGRWDSADVTDWRPTTFLLHSMPANYAGTFDSADVSDWRPTTLYLYSMPSGYGGTFDSADVSDWRPSNFRLYSMPSGYGGTFDSADVADWRPTFFYLFSMPSGYAGTFDTADLSSWNPTSFYYMLNPATMTLAISADSLKNWTALTDLRLRNMDLSTAQVDLALWELYQAATTPRTATGGTILLAGNNDPATGTYQASTDDPVTGATDGAEVAYELRFDSLEVGYNPWATVEINEEE